MTEGGDIQGFIERHRRLFVLTGAGCSTSSGIPDYRDADGKWKRTPPVTYQAFMGDEAMRRRYWARSLIGWRRFGQARPNDAHRALARLEAMGRNRAAPDPERRPAASGGRQRARDRPARAARSGPLHGVRAARRRATSCRTNWAG